MKRTALVQCTLIVPVEIDTDDNYQFAIEDNSCPASGIVWFELQRIMEEHDKTGTCWGCALQGENKILEIK